MADLQKIADDLSGLTVLEASELTKILEEKWGVSAAAPVAKAVTTTYLEKYYPELRKKNIEKEKLALQKLMKKLEEEKRKKELEKES